MWATPAAVLRLQASSGSLPTRDDPPVRAEGDAPRGIETYTPRDMAPDLWELCAGAVRDALRVIAQTAPRDVRMYASTLTWFLSVTDAWDQQSPPDLAQLLTLANIDRAVANAALPPVSAKNRRAWLRRAARDLGAIPEQSIPHRGQSPRPPDPRLVRGAALPVPFAVLADAWMAASGRRLTGDLLYPVATLLQVRPTVTAGRVVTVHSPASIQVLVEANDSAQVISVDSRGTLPDTRPPKRPSRRAVLARAKQLARSTKPVIPAPEVDPEVEASIAAYRPSPKYATAWEANRALAVRLATGYRPPTARNAKLVCSVLAGFLTFVSIWPARTSTGAIRPEDLTEDVIAAWVAASSLKDSSRATFRTVVRRAVRSLNPDRAPLKVSYKPAAAPYTSLEVASWARLATTQPTQARTAALSFVVGLAAGAGLDAADLRSVRAADISEIALPAGGRVLTVTTHNPRRPRTVPVRSLYEPLVRTALELHADLGKGPGDLVVGRVADRVTVTRRSTRTARTATGDVVVELTRLRNTWLVALMCAPLPLADLLRAAGLAGSRTLTDLLPYCPPSDQAAVTRVLTVIGSPR